MAKTHPPYPPAFRVEAVEPSWTSGQAIPRLAAEPGISEQALHGWRKRADVDTGRGQPGDLASAEREELRRLRREHQILRWERETLTNAAASFAPRSAYGRPAVAGGVTLRGRGFHPAGAARGDRGAAGRATGLPQRGGVSVRREPCEVATFCPRCGKPIVWSMLPTHGGHQLEVTGYSCHCPLSDEEWDDLTDEAAKALVERDDHSDHEVRRVVEDLHP